MAKFKKRDTGRKSNLDRRRFDSQNRSVERVREGVFIYQGQLSVQTLAERLGVPLNEVLRFLFLEQINVNINSLLDDSLIELICINFGFDCRNEEVKSVTDFEQFKIEDDAADLILRAPIVTIMGHVDHGKTTLLDYIRHTQIAKNEAGGITQAIGAYQVEVNGQKITFLDTPGHAAFAAMRARGADVTDIVVLVVAADDGVMPQTQEAIEHAKLAGVPIIVAINKMDRPDADPERIMQVLSDFDLLPEAWGGSTIYREISAKIGDGVNELLEDICLIAEMKELKANPHRYALGRVLEAELDKGLGPVATLIIQNGTLKIGDSIVVGAVYGKVRNMYDDRGQQIKAAPPSTAVRITGLNDVPLGGNSFMAFADDRQARAIAEERNLTKVQAEREGASIATNIDELMANSDGKFINIIIKADSQGSAEAIKNAIGKIEAPGYRFNIIRAAAGGITESDILLATAGRAVIYGFNVRPDQKVRNKAEEEKIEIRLYRVIYQLINDLEAIVKGLEQPEIKEVVHGQAEVRQLFRVSRIGTIAGCNVVSGLIKARGAVRLIRDGVVIYEGQIASLRRYKDEVKEARQGFDCGILIENYNDVKEGDIIECHEMVEVTPEGGK